MVTAQFQPFFTASVAASAALIGLLFVSVSIAPERVFGQQSDSVRQAQALSAFSALTNIFFISLLSLIPDVLFGVVVTIVCLPAIMQTLGLLVHLRQWRTEGILVRGVFLFFASAFIYGYELALGTAMWRNPSDKGSLVGLTFVLIGAYALGLGRAWELLGAPRSGIITRLLARLYGAPKPPPGKPPASGR